MRSGPRCEDDHAVVNVRLVFLALDGRLVAIQVIVGGEALHGLASQAVGMGWRTTTTR